LYLNGRPNRFSIKTVAVLVGPEDIYFDEFDGITDCRASMVRRLCTTIILTRRCNKFSPAPGRAVGQDHDSLYDACRACPVGIITRWQFDHEPLILFTGSSRKPRVAGLSREYTYAAQGRMKTGRRGKNSARKFRCRHDTWNSDGVRGWLVRKGCRRNTILS